MTTTRLSREAFAAALRRGHGRALQHVREYGLEGMADLVLEACIHSQKYDSQAEDSRAEWLLDMFHGTAEYGRFSAAILSALSSETETANLQHLCELAERMASRGDEAAHSALSARALRQAEGEPDLWVGADELVKLDGVDAVVQLARRYGQLLIQDPEEMIPSLEGLYFGLDGGVPAEAQETLQALSVSEPEIMAYWDHELRDRASRTSNLNSEDAIRERVRRQYSLHQILADATAASSKHPSQYMLFGKYATSDELELAFQHLIEEPDEDVCIRLLWIFRRAQIPRLNSRLWRFAASANEQLQDATFEALARLRHPSIGEYARGMLRADGLTETDLSVLKLLVLNYRPEDGELIGAALRRINPETESVHGIGMTILEICKENCGTELFEALNWVYEHTLCSNCRGKAVEFLLRLRKIAPEVLEECRYDAIEKIRSMAREFGRNRQEPARQAPRVINGVGID